MKGSDWRFGAALDDRPVDTMNRQSSIQGKSLEVSFEFVYIWVGIVPILFKYCPLAFAFISASFVSSLSLPPSAPLK